MCRYTKGFERTADRDEHFKRHVVVKKDTAAANSIEYELMADSLVGRAGQPSVYSCCRRSGKDMLVYDASTNEFAIVCPNQYITTYYHPSTAWNRCSSNFEYFEKTCRDEKC